MITPTLISERLTLRAPSLLWREAFTAFAQSPRARWFTGLQAPGADWTFLSICTEHWDERGYGPFCLYNKSDETPVGIFAIWQPEWRTQPGLMWFLFEGQEGKGYVPEAARVSARWHLEHTEVREATSHIDKENTRSQKTAERLKGQFVCEFERHNRPHYRYLHKLEDMAQ